MLTTLTILVLKFFDPEKSRPSIDDGASAPEHMTVQQRLMNAVSLKNMAQRMLFLAKAGVAMSALTCTWSLGCLRDQVLHGLALPHSPCLLFDTPNLRPALSRPPLLSAVAFSIQAGFRNCRE